MRDSSGRSRAGAALTTHSPFPRSQASLGSVERRSWPLPPKPARGRCLGEKRNHTYQTGVIESFCLSGSGLRTFSRSFLSDWG